MPPPEVRAGSACYALIQHDTLAIDYYAIAVDDIRHITLASCYITLIILARRCRVIGDIIEAVNIGELR